MSIDPQHATRLREKLSAFLNSLEGEQIIHVSITLSVDEQYFLTDRPRRPINITHSNVIYQDASFIGHRVRNIITLLKKEPPSDQH